MKIFLSNPTKQRQNFQFRTDVSPRGGVVETSYPHSVILESGHQVSIGPGCDFDVQWTKAQFDYVMKQLHRRGARDAAEAHGQLGKFTFLIYRIDNAVDEDEIVMAHEAIVDTQIKRSVEQATRGALAFDRTANALSRGKGRMTKISQVEVHQQLGPHERPTGNEVHFDMTIDPVNGASRMPI